MWPLLPAVIGAGVDLAGMLFSRHMSNTAHQREVRDMRAAGLNPMWMGAGSGAPMPQVPSFGADIQAGLNSGYTLEAERSERIARTRLSQMTADQIQALTPYKMALLQGQIKVADMSAKAKELMLPVMIDELRARIMATTNSARNSAALAELNEAALTGQLNIQEMEKKLGESSPEIRFIVEVLRGLTGSVFPSISERR